MRLKMAKAIRTRTQNALGKQNEICKAAIFRCYSVTMSALEHTDFLSTCSLDQHVSRVRLSDPKTQLGSLRSTS